MNKLRHIFRFTKYFLLKVFVVITFIAEMNLMKIWTPNIYLSFFTIHTKQVTTEVTSVVNVGSTWL